jgi:hypothetical protein
VLTHRPFWMSLGSLCSSKTQSATTRVLEERIENLSLNNAITQVAAEINLWPN